MTIPKSIARYEIVRQLGQGGMGTVYLAHDPRMQRQVAIKVLPQLLLHDPAFRTRFENEASTMARITDDAIVTAYDYGEWEGQPYLVMQYMPGGSLADKLTQGPMSLQATKSIVSRLAPALDLAHSLGIIHRDLKPGNILFDHLDRAGIADFGIAKVMQNTQSLTRSGTTIGTPEYMSPEQFSADDIDGRSDQYALGIIIFQMLTGKVPFQGDTWPRLLHKHLMDPVPNVGKLMADFPAGLQEFFEKCLAKKPEQRFDSVAALAQSFRELGMEPERRPPTAEQEAATIIEMPTRLPNTDTAPHQRRSEPVAAKKSRLPVWIGAGLAAILAGVAGWFLLNGNNATPTATPTSESAVEVVAEITNTDIPPTVTEVIPTEVPATEAPTNTAVPPTAVPEPTAEIDEEVELAPMAATVLNGSLPDTAGPISLDNISEIREVVRWGKGGTNNIALDPAGITLAVAGEIGIWLYDYPSFDELGFIETSRGRVLGLDWSPDGAKLAYGLNNRELHVQDVIRNEVLVSFEGHEGGVGHVAWSPDGTRLVSSSFDDTARIWNAETGEQLQLLDVHEDWVTAAEWSPDGSQLATVSLDSNVRIWDTATWELSQTPVSLGEDLDDVDWSPDGTRLAIANRDDSVNVFDVASNALDFNLNGHGVAVSSVAWSPDGNFLVSGGGDNEVRVWDVQRGVPHQVLAGHADWVENTIWSVDGTQVISVAQDATVIAWDPNTGNRIDTLEDHTRAVRNIAWSPDGSAFAVVPEDESVEIWNPAQAQLLYATNHHSGDTQVLAWSPDGAQYVVGSKDKTLTILNALSGEVVHTLSGHDNWVTAIAWSPDGSKVASGSWNGEVFVWDAATGAQVQTLAGLAETTNAVVWSPDSTRVAAAGREGVIHIWNAASADVLFRLEENANQTSDLDWSSDGNTLVSANWDGAARFWDLNTGELTKAIGTNLTRMDVVKLSPDNEFLATGNVSGELRIWNADTGIDLAVFQDHVLQINDLAWSPDGGWLAAAGEDGSVRFYGVADASGAEIQTLTWGDYTAELAYSPQPADIEFKDATLTIRQNEAEVVSDNIGAFLRDSLGSLGYQLQVLDNLDDDPYPELLFTDVTAGASCCDVLYAVDFTSETEYTVIQGPTRRWGQAPTLITENAQSPADFRTRNSEFGFSVGIEGAISDLAIMQVLRFADGAFQDVTSDYPDILAADEARWLTELDTGPSPMMYHNYVATKLYQGQADAACDLIDAAIAAGDFGYETCADAITNVAALLDDSISSLNR